MKKTDDQTLVSALRILARDIESGDGVANAAIAEAADRLEELTQPNVVMLPPLPDGFNSVRSGKVRRGDWFLWHLRDVQWNIWPGGLSEHEYIRAVRKEKDNEN